MNRRFVGLGAIVLVAVSGTSELWAADEAGKPEASAAASIDDAARKAVAPKVDRLIDAIKLGDDAQKSARVKGIVGDWLVAMKAWHKEHDAELAGLWGEWNKARAVVPKDEFPGEVIATKIEGIYASLKPTYDQFVQRLSAELTPEQVDALKEHWSRSPGMMRTYNAYLEIVPDLSEKDREVIKARMLMAREAAMLTDSDKEIVAIYKRHKVKVEQYVGTLEWAKLHKAFGERGKRASEANAKKADDANAKSPVK